MNNVTLWIFSFQLVRLLSMFIAVVGAIFLPLQRSTSLCQKNERKKYDVFAVTVVVWNIMQVLKHWVRKETF